MLNSDIEKMSNEKSGLTPNDQEGNSNNQDKINEFYRDDN